MASTDPAAKDLLDSINNAETDGCLVIINTVIGQSARAEARLQKVSDGENPY